jgi:hypothetical protein
MLDRKNRSQAGKIFPLKKAVHGVPTSLRQVIAVIGLTFIIENWKEIETL